MMMSFAVLGLRGVFSLPISLNANWVLRIAQLQPTGRYFAATRRALLLFGVAPVLIIAFLLSLNFRPWRDVEEHLVILVLLGCVFVEFALYKFDKVPFTCSYLPGKANIQVIFWGFAFLGMLFGITGAVYEMGALHDASKYATMAGVLLAGIVALGSINLHRAKSAVLYFEEKPAEIITRLGLIFVPPAESSSK